MKAYQINLSDHKKEIKGSDVKMRELELIILESLFTVASTKEKDLRKNNQILDSLEMIDALEDDASYITFDKADIDFLREGFKISAENRPSVWTKARELFKQIESPEEKDI